LIVVDASVLADVLLRREEALEALEEAVTGREHEPLHAPEVIEPETLNAVRKMSLHGRVTARRATEAVADLGNVRLIRYPHAPLRFRIWELRDQLTAYDAAYVALAEALGGALLLTSDRALATAARRLLGADAVRAVG
jgi:predicted nucleic acid-binding protein